MTRRRSPAARIARCVLLFMLVVSPVASSDTTPDPTHGTWSALPPPQARHGHTVVHDATRDRVVLFGGYGEMRRSDVWGLSLADGQWARLIPSGVRPAERFGHSALIDPLRDRMIVCGGEVEDGADWLSDLHVLSLVPEPSWSPLAALGPAPPGRMEHTAALDAPRDRMIVFGGRAGLAVWDDVWALALGDTPRWERIDTAEPRPASRSGHVAIVDAEADRMIVFGGADGTLTFGDLWQLTLTGTPEWTEIVAGGEAPPPLERATGVFDPAQRRLLVFGGMESGGALSAATYSLDLETMTWSRLEPAGTLPSHRYRHATGFDAVRGRMVVIGGSDPSLENDVWALDAGAAPHWTEVSDLGTPGPSRWAPTLVYEPEGDRMLVFGGMPQADCCTYFRTDTRALRLGGAPRWSGVTTTGPAPGVVLHTTIYDPVRERLVLFGGLTGGDVANTTWTLALGQTPPAWSSLASTGPPPGARSQHVAVYDSRRDRMIIFGGAYFGPAGMRPWADAWALSLSGLPTWSLLMAEGTGPTARGLSAAIYDPVRDRMLVYGGSGTHETWELTLAGTPQWRLIPTTGDAPAAPQMCGAIYDPIRDRMVVRGGIDASSGHSTNVWALSLDDHKWTHLAPGGPILPASRDDDHFVYDPRRDRIIAHGGWDPPDGLGDTWMLTWGTPTTPGIDFLDPPEWSGSSPVVVKLEVDNPLDGNRVIEWSLSIDRDFPGLPMRGQVLVGSVSKLSFNIEVPVPPGVSAVDAQIEARAWFAGALGNDSRAERIVQDGTTATLASLVSAEVAPGRARLVWSVGPRPSVGIERREPDSEWRAIAERSAQDGLVEIVDTSVEPGGRYAYRLAWRDARGAVVAGEQWVDVPAVLALALHGGRPNPAQDRFGVAFTLPSRGRAKLEVFDLAGRRLAGRALDREAGFHVVPMPESASWPAGVYLVRLGFEARVLEARIAIVR